MYELTEEGKKYLKEGLPERNLVKLLLDRDLPFGEAKKLENFNIALQWAKKNNWIKVEEEFLKLTDEGRKSATSIYPAQDALKNPDSAGEDET
ncbi:MAG: hypothetical protein ACP5E4_04940, partial [Candidatus Aenigmatarchaeota archaeon]